MQHAMPLRIINYTIFIFNYIINHIIPFLLFYCAKNNVVQTFRLVYKSQAVSLGYNAHLIMRNGISHSRDNVIFQLGNGISRDGINCWSYIMEEAQFLELSRNFKNIRERLSQLPSLIDSMMAEELRLRRYVYFSNQEDKKVEIERIKMEREKLQTEMIEKKAFLPILRKQLMDASKKICDTRVKNEVSKIDELKENIKSAKLKLKSLIDEAIKTSAELWGTEQIYNHLVDHVVFYINENLKNNSKLAKVGMEEQLSVTIDKHKKDHETLLKLMQFSTSNNDSNKEITKPSEQKAKEDNVIKWLDNILDN